MITSGRLLFIVSSIVSALEPYYSREPRSFTDIRRFPVECSREITMPDDAPLKSAYDIAMERLRARDREKGIPERKPLTADQKREIARLRKDAKAKLAELEIMHKKNLASERDDPEKIKKIEEHFEIDRGRIESALESAIAKVRERS
jgi:hypothetical protein